MHPSKNCCRSISLSKLLDTKDIVNEKLCKDQELIGLAGRCTRAATSWKKLELNNTCKHDSKSTVHNRLNLLQILVLDS